jgi:hypothetical protein
MRDCGFSLSVQQGKGRAEGPTHRERDCGQGARFAAAQIHLYFGSTVNVHFLANQFGCAEKAIQHDQPDSFTVVFQSQPGVLAQAAAICNPLSAQSNTSAARTLSAPTLNFGASKFERILGPCSTP